MRQARRWTMMLWGGGMLIATLLVAFGTVRPTGGLWDQLRMGQGPQRAEAAPSQANAPLATVRLAVEGMVCYG
jgi:hypothetical protein